MTVVKDGERLYPHSLKELEVVDVLEIVRLVQKKLKKLAFRRGVGKFVDP